MIHQYINNGFYIVLDVNSGSVHSVDPLLYDAIKLLSGRLADMKEPAPVPRKTAEEVAELLKEKYSADEIQAVSYTHLNLFMSRMGGRLCSFSD